MQDPEDEEKSDFNFILIDLKEKTQDIKQYTWNGFLYNVKTASKKPFEFGKSLKKFKFEINNEFKINFLEDIGASFTHPRKSKLSLGDLYIFPNLRDLESYELKEKNVYDTIVNSVKIISLKDKKNKIMIIGDNKSGKSSLCKMLYMNYYNKNYIPIYIEGDSIKSQKIEKFNKLIENNFKEQYSENKITLFKQTPKKEKYLIIDDIDNSNLNVKFRTLLLEEICKYYDNIIITANNLFQFEDMAYFKRKSSYILKNFKRFEILEFGVILRNKLIRKWNILGREHLISDSDLLKINDKSEQIIDVIIGNNYVPSHPIFLLTILQAIEIGKPLDLQESRYGYYYQLLITQAMNKANITADEQDLYFNYLAELANYLFKQRNKEISKSNFIIFHNAFCEEYKLELNFEKIIYRFLKASLIEEKNGIYRFRYKYIYYFFIAKFISDNITKSDIQKRISNICNKLFVEEYANIIIFLVHHSKDPFILDEIRKRSLFLFKEIEHIKFESDTKFINDFIKDIPSLVLLDKDVEKVRENILKRRDKAEILLKEKERKKRIEDELDKEIDDLGFFSKVNLGIKVLNILGHTLKNYYGSLKGNDKYILAKEAYFLGLRTLKIFLFLCLYSLVQNEDFIKEIMKKILKRKYKNKPIDNKIIEKETQKFLFNICILISFVFIKIISKSIGSENLSKTFKDILGKNNFNAVRLIDISIKLDFMRNLPIDDLKYLKCVFKGNIFPYILLKHLVIDHIYMFPTTYEMKQKISDLFNIPIKSQYTIELYSPLKKK